MNLPKTLLAFAVFASSISAQPKLSSYFTDNMVIQRETPISIDGTASANTTVQGQLESLEKSYTASAQSKEDGSFVLTFDPLPAGGPYKLTVTEGDESVSIQSILMGDIWICSGQSNMEWPLSQTENSELAIAKSHQPNIRLFHVPRSLSDHPAENVSGGPWQVAEPSVTKDFSAVGYYFGKELAERTGVPIGLVSAPWGGTIVEIWINNEAIQSDPSMRYLQNAASIINPESEAILPRVAELISPNFEAGASLPSIIQRQSEHPSVSSIAYNAMIHPLTRYPIKGVIWYQGESNADRAEEYQALFKLLINSWRNQWSSPELPFYFVQLANYNPGEVDDHRWAELREAQSKALELPATGMATTIDIGNRTNIHPLNKCDVGHRLALHALTHTYAMEVGPTSGPTLKSATPIGAKIILEFENIADGLTMRSPSNKAFEVASKDGPYHFAEVVLEDDKITLSSPEVPKPIYARYAWANDPSAPLYNSSNLPAPPFRTDDRPLITSGLRYVSSTITLQPGYRENFLKSRQWIDRDGIRIATSSFQHGNPIEHAFDGDSETRWSSSGIGSLVLADLGPKGSCKSIGLTLFRGKDRQTIFRVEASSNGEHWEELFFGQSSGTTEGEEKFELPKNKARYLLISFYGNTNSTWNSVSEIEFH